MGDMSEGTWHTQGSVWHPWAASTSWRTRGKQLDLKVTIHCERSSMALTYKCKIVNTSWIPTWLGCGLFLLCPEAVPVWMHSGLQAVFQQNSSLYTVEPKGPDCEWGSTNDVDPGHLHCIKSEEVQLHTKILHVNIVRIPEAHWTYSRISAAEFGW